MSLVTKERELYETAWAMPAYSEYAPGEGLVPVFQAMSGAKARQTVLDAGCGSGKGALALKAAGFDVRMCDLTDAGLVDEAKALPFKPACLWSPLKPQLGYQSLGNAVDWVYCCDVMEHIPQAFTMLVVSRLLEVAKRGVFLSISLQQDQFGAWIGQSLHQTVKDFVWWKEQLSAVGTVGECRDFIGSGVYLVTAC